MNFGWRWQSVLAAALLALSADAATGRIVKALPHYLDLKGRHTIHPSLFERDAYQAKLRRAPELCSTMRFDVQWKAKGTHGPVRLRLEARGQKTPLAKPEVFEAEIPKPRRFSQWTAVTIPKESFERLGGVVAWRVVLWDGDTQIAEQKSFLW